MDNSVFLPGYLVNQRGQTSYTGAANCVDRWRLYNATYNVDTGELISNGEWGQLNQITDKYEILAGKTVTVSILFDSLDDGWRLRLHDDGMMVNIPTDSNLFTHTYIYPHDAQTRDLAICLMNFTAGAKCKPIAAKLELGSQQTLAHQDANGNWVLNELPNYALELLKCQRYQFSNLTDGADNGGAIGAATAATYPTELYVSIQFPVEMRAKPSIEIVRIWNYTENNSWQQIPGNHLVRVSSKGTGYVMSDHTFQSGQLYGVQVFANANL